MWKCPVSPSPRSSRRLCSQLAGMEDFTALHRANLPCFECRDRYRLALSGDEFDLYRLPVPVLVHDRADVTFLETISRQGAAQDNHVQVIDDHFFTSLAGYAVTKRGLSSPGSTIQTVRTLMILPWSVIILPWTTYLIP